MSYSHKAILENIVPLLEGRHFGTEDLPHHLSHHIKLQCHSTHFLKWNSPPFFHSPNCLSPNRRLFLFSLHIPLTFSSSCCRCLAAAALSSVEGSSCMCRNPCNMTRYNKELSMVKIPSKTSARYLEKKFNRSEKYITWVFTGSNVSILSQKWHWLFRRFAIF